MNAVVVQRGSWQGSEADIELEAETASAFLTAAHDFMAETQRPVPEIVEPNGGLRSIATTTEMQWAFDYGPHGKYRASATPAQKMRSAALYLKHNMSTVSIARPVIDGTHTTGFYLDIGTAVFQAWLLAGNAARYGLTRPLGNADPNHWRYTPRTATAALTITSLGLGEIPTGDDTVNIIEDRGPSGTTLTGNLWWATDRGRRGKVDLTKFPVPDAVRPILEKTFGPIVGLSTNDFNSVMSVYDSAAAVEPTSGAGLTSTQLDAAVKTILAAIPTTLQITGTAKA